MQENYGGGSNRELHGRPSRAHDLLGINWGLYSVKTESEGILMVFPRENMPFEMRDPAFDQIAVTPIPGYFVFTDSKLSLLVGGFLYLQELENLYRVPQLAQFADMEIIDRGELNQILPNGDQKNYELQIDSFAKAYIFYNRGQQAIRFLSQFHSQNLIVKPDETRNEMLNRDYLSVAFIFANARHNRSWSTDANTIESVHPEDLAITDEAKKRKDRFFDSQSSDINMFRTLTLPDDVKLQIEGFLNGEDDGVFRSLDMDAHKTKAWVSGVDWVMILYALRHEDTFKQVESYFQRMAKTKYGYEYVPIGLYELREAALLLPEFSLGVVDPLWSPEKRAAFNKANKRVALLIQSLQKDIWEYTQFAPERSGQNYFLTDQMPRIWIALYEFLLNPLANDPMAIESVVTDTAISEFNEMSGSLTSPMVVALRRRVVAEGFQTKPFEFLSDPVQSGFVNQFRGFFDRDDNSWFTYIDKDSDGSTIENSPFPTAYFAYFVYVSRNKVFIDIVEKTYPDYPKELITLMRKLNTVLLNTPEFTLGVPNGSDFKEERNRQNVINTRFRQLFERVTLLYYESLNPKDNQGKRVPVKEYGSIDSSMSFIERMVSRLKLAMYKNEQPMDYLYSSDEMVTYYAEVREFAKVFTKYVLPILEDEVANEFAKNLR